jgi:hypothetical protein
LADEPVRKIGSPKADRKREQARGAPEGSAAARADFYSVRVRKLPTRLEKLLT